MTTVTTKKRKDRVDIERVLWVRHCEDPQDPSGAFNYLRVRKNSKMEGTQLKVATEPKHTM